MLEIINRDSFSGYEFEYVHVSIDCFEKWLKQQKVWTFEVEILIYPPTK